MDNNMKQLLTPFQIGNVQLKNRFVMGPLGGGSFFDYKGVYTQTGIDFHVARAKGGFGMIITGGFNTDIQVENFNPLNGMSPMFAPLQFHKGAYVLTEQCAAYDTKVFAQITTGVGRNYPTFHAPSAVECYNFPNLKAIELTKDEIHIKQDQCIQAALAMKKAGFAGVDLHALHWGYLMDQFALAITNHREDEYGGPLENRLRFVREIVTGIHQLCGDDYPITIGLGCKSFIKGLNRRSLHGEDEAGRTLDEAIRIAKMLEEMGIAAIHTDVGLYDSYYHACPPSYMPRGHALEYTAAIKQNVSIPVMARSRMGDATLCAEAVGSGMADAVVLARPALADPCFPRKVEAGTPEKIRPCIACNVGCIGAQQEKKVGAQCAVNPRAYNESSTKPKKTTAPRNIAVVGGGVAGMQAALTAVECGHRVALWEKSSILGGAAIAAGAHEGKDEVRELYGWFIRELQEKEVPVHLNAQLTSEMAKEQGIDTVIFALGAEQLMPKSIKGIEKAMSAVDLLAGGRETGEKVIVVGGGMVGCETAVDLAGQGKRVTLVEALPQILSAEFVPHQHKTMLIDLLADRGVEILDGNKLLEITDTGIIVAPTAGGDTCAVEADSVVMSIGRRPRVAPVAEFYGNGMEVYNIGDSRRPGSIYNAIHDAFTVVYNFD